MRVKNDKARKIEMKRILEPKARLTKVALVECSECEVIFEMKVPIELKGQDTFISRCPQCERTAELEIIDEDD